MTGKARTIVYKPRAGRTGLSLVLVECPACPARFLSAAAKRSRCPECGQDLRVHRSPQARRVGGPQQPAPPAVQQAPVSVRQSAAFPISLVPVRQAAPTPPALVLPLAADDDNDLVYIYDQSGQLVLAGWDGARLVPALSLPGRYLARELPARGWLLRPHGQGICQVVRTWPTVAGWPAASEECHRPAEHGELCRKCFEALRTPA